MGLIIWIGPGETIHHQLHKWDIRPYFYECCCVNEDHTECAWDDHFGKPWRYHHPGISRAGLFLLLISLVSLGISSYVLRKHRETVQGFGVRCKSYQTTES